MERTKKASKENRGIILVVSILLIGLLLTGAGGYTYARYMSQEKGTGSAKIAQWVFEIDKNGSTTKTINLGSTVNKATLVNGKIAPGTSGSFEIKLNSTGSEVGVDYVLNFANEKNKPNNLTFTYDGRTANSLKDIGDIRGSFPAKGLQTKTIKIDWKWPYQTGGTTELKAENDAKDLKNAKDNLEYTFEIIAQGTQSE